MNNDMPEPDGRIPDLLRTLRTGRELTLTQDDLDFSFAEAMAAARAAEHDPQLRQRLRDLVEPALRQLAAHRRARPEEDDAREPELVAPSSPDFAADVRHPPDHWQLRRFFTVPRLRSELEEAEAGSLGSLVHPATDHALTGRGPLVGRDDELARLHAMLKTTGAGRCVVVVASAGFGKTRLLAETIRAARAQNLTVAVGRATGLDRMTPTSTLMSALRGVADLRPGLPPPPTGEPGAPTLRYVDDLVEALDRYATTRPLLVAIDDFHWADELSAFALRMLVPALAGASVRWLLARRPARTPTAGGEAAAWLVADGADELPLPPLDDPAVARLCANVLGATADASVLATTARCRGNPFAIEQMLVAMRDSGQIMISHDTATVVGDEPPSSVAAAVVERLHGLPAGTRELLTTGAVLGRAFEVGEVARLAGTPAWSLSEPVDRALAAGLLVATGDQLDFAHELLRQVIYADLPPRARSDLHRHAAALGSGGRPPVEIAEHLIRAGGADLPRAAQILRSAARDMAVRAPAVAADLIARAVSMVDGRDPVRAEMYAEAAILLSTAGRLAEAREAGEVALVGGLDPRSETAMFVRLAEASKQAGQNAAAVQYARRGMARPGIDDRARARLQAVAAHALLWSDLAAADAAGAEADRLGTAGDDPRAAVFGQAARVVVALAAGRVADAVIQAERAVARADEAGGAAARRHPRIWLGAALVGADRIKEAREVFAVGRLEAERLGTAWSLPLWHTHDAEALVALGQLDAAWAEAEAGLRLAGQISDRQMAVPLLTVLATVAALRADRHSAEDSLRRMRELLAAGVTSAPEDLAWAMAVVHEADHRYDRAMDAVAGLCDAMPDRLLLLTMNPGAAPTLVRVALAAGDWPRAARVAAAIQALADRNPGVAAMGGAARHAAGLLTGDLDALHAAVWEYEGSDRRLDHARAVEDCGRVEGERGDRARAIELLTRALHWYREFAATAATGRVERRLRTLGVPPGRTPRPGNDGPLGRLSHAELMVVEKIAEGRTTKETAEALRLSRHTVDSHLRNVFSKLGINSRSELARLAISFRTGP